MFSLKYKLINFFTQNKSSSQHRRCSTTISSEFGGAGSNKKTRSKSASAADSMRSANRHRTISENESRRKNNNKEYERMSSSSSQHTSERIINIDTLSLNEFRSLLSNKVKDRFIDNIKLNQLLTLLPSGYEHDADWCIELTIAEIKSLLWMDDYELYPLKIKEIKNILNELKPSTTTIARINSDSKNNLLYKDEAINNNSTEKISIANSSASNSTSSSTLSSSPFFDGRQMCKICTQLIADCVYIDCGHIVSCTNCSKTLTACPMCKKNIINFIKAY